MNRIIAVGSKNPVKIRAVELASQAYWEDVSVVAQKVKPRISNMPISKAEARIGAKNRAYNARKITNSWIGIGHEGGICQIEKDWYLFSCTFATDGKIDSWGSETLIKLTDQIIGELGNFTTELGIIMDRITGKENIKQKEGAVGYLTNQKISRTDIFRLSSLMALSAWVKKG